MNLNIDYEKAIDFEHCNSINDAMNRLSILTNLLNRVLIIRQKCKQEILVLCGKHSDEKLHKLSWENKIVCLLSLEPCNELIELWEASDTAYRQIKNKQDQVVEDLMALKKIADISPR